MDFNISGCFLVMLKLMDYKNNLKKGFIKLTDFLINQTMRQLFEGICTVLPKYQLQVIHWDKKS